MHFNFKSQDEEKTELEYDVSQNKSIYVDSTTSNEIYPEEESGYDGFEINLEDDEELEKIKNTAKNEIIVTSTQKIKIKKATGKFDNDLQNESFYSRDTTTSKKPSVKEEDEKSNNSDVSDISSSSSEGEDYDDDESEEGRDIDESDIGSEEDNESDEGKSSSESPETTIKTIAPTTTTKSTPFKAISISKTEAATKAASLQTSTISKAARVVFTVANSGIHFCLPIFISLHIFVQYAAYL